MDGMACLPFNIFRYPTEKGILYELHFNTVESYICMVWSIQIEDKISALLHCIPAYDIHLISTNSFLNIVDISISIGFEP